MIRAQVQADIHPSTLFPGEPHCSGNDIRRSQNGFSGGQVKRIEDSRVATVNTDDIKYLLRGASSGIPQSVCSRPLPPMREQVHQDDALSPTAVRRWLGGVETTSGH